MGEVTLELADDGPGASDRRGMVPPPLPPDDPEAWYAPDVQSQYEVHPGVVVTITRQGTEFTYEVREPPLTGADEQKLERVTSHFADAQCATGG